MNKFNDDEGRQLFHKTDTESALTYLREMLLFKVKQYLNKNVIHGTGENQKLQGKKMTRDKSL
jgi:hypothetical protein